MEKTSEKQWKSDDTGVTDMKYGIYYAYWSKEWGGNFIPYIPKIKKLGFEILEVNCGGFPEMEIKQLKELRRVSQEEGKILTGGYGPRPEHNLSSQDPEVINCAFKFWRETLKRMEIAGIDRIGGALYSYWPVDFSVQFDKEEDTARSIENITKLADIAADFGVTLNMEVINRFEGYMLNICDEAVRFVEAVNKPNVKIMLDTFHMNIEEDSLVNAVRKAGKRLGHLHVGEANRRLPNENGRIQWEDIGKTLKEIDYDRYVIMEPFERMGGQVGKDIFIWRDLSNGASEEQLDALAASSVAYLRSLWG